MGGQNSWPPGFRFHPTDEELILYYLKRKINRRPLKLDIIAEIDVYKLEPEELPGLALLKNGDRQWFFFSPRDRKYPNGLRSNRSTKHGYWKATGKDRIITCNSRNVGIKKTLVFYRGRAPSGERTDWVMHEYTLDEDEFRRCQNAQDYYAIYKLFKKSGPGPKNGEQYGAPFREEEWLDDDESPGSTSLCNHANHVPEVNTDVLAADSSREYQRHLSADDIDEVLNSIIAEPPPQRDDVRPEIISNFANHVQEVKDNADASRDQQRHLTLDDVDEFMNRIIAEPPPPPPQALDIYDFEQALSEFVGEEGTQSQSTLDHVSSGEVIQPEPVAYSSGIRHDGLEGNLNASPTASGLQMWDVPQVASSNNLTGLSRDVADDDFLEMDDLLGSDPVQVPNEAMPPYIGNNNLLQNPPQLEQDGLNEFDLFYDADFNVDDLLSDYQAQPSTSYSDPHGGEVVDQPSNSGMELYSDSVNNAFGNEMWSYANTYMPTTSSLNQQHLPVPTRGVVYGGNSTNVPTEPNQNQPGKEGEEGWFSSTLWSFVESIPAAPASAAEATLVNKAFVRMSSFSRLRINPKTMNAANVSVPPAAAVGGTMRGLFMFSFLVMVFAVACVFLGSNIGVFGKAVRRVNL